MTNSITITGNVGKDPRVRMVGSDTVLGFGLAFTPRKREGDDWVDAGPTLWFDVSAWGDLAERYGNDIAQGSRVTVSGAIGSREHNGVTYITLRASSLTLEPKKSGTTSAPLDRVTTPDPWANVPAADENVPF